MFKEGWQTKDGKPMARATMWNLLRDVFYCGNFKYKGIVYKGNHEALTSEEVFQAVQKKITKKVNGKYAKHHFLFRGLISCPDCGFSITFEKQKGIVYGHCTGHSGCKARSTFTRADVIEKQIKAS